MNKWMMTFINCLLTTLVFSQPVVKENDEWMNFIHGIAESTGNEQDINNLYEELSQIHEHPFNINRIKREELERLPFLTDEQIENIQAYLYISGPMKTIYELKLVKDLDMETIKLLIPFVYIGDPPKADEAINWRQLLRRGKSRLYFRLDSNPDQKEGYRSPVDSTDTNKYLGSPLYSFVKYEFNAGNKLQMGFLVEKDAGERIRDGFRSFHLLLKDVGRIKRLALGRYKLAFGQGLVMNTNFSLGKNIIATNIASRPEGVSRHNSTDELNYLQGAAVTLDLHNHYVSAFASVKKAAASLDDSIISSLKTDAYFNTENDLKQRNNVTMYLVGMNWQRRFGRFKLGTTALCYAFDKRLSPEIRRDNYFAFRGKENANLSVDYQYRFSRLFFFGETAISRNGSMATLNGLHVNATSSFKTSLLQRSYSKSYHAYYSASFAESSRTENEQGLYWGAEWHPYRFWKVSGYTDIFRFPWLKYGVSAPSSGFDGLLQVDYSPGEKLNMYIRYRYKEKEKDRFGEDVLYKTEKYNTQRFRWQCEYGALGQLLFHTTVDYNRYKEESGEPGEGFAFTQSVSQEWKKVPLKIDMQLMMFDTDGYDNSIYSYEKSVLYAFSIPSFYGKGYRWMVNARYNLSSRLTFWLKYAQTVYSDRDVIGSGPEEIRGNQKNDLYFLLRWKF